MNTIKLPPLPDIPAAICPWDHSEGVVKNLLEAYATAAIEADRQARGEPVALEYLRSHSNSIRCAFETLKGYKLLDETDDASYYDHEIRVLDEVLAATESDPQTLAKPVVWVNQTALEWATKKLASNLGVVPDKTAVYTVPLYLSPQPPQIPEGHNTIIRKLLDRIYHEGCTPLDWPEYEAARAMLEAAPEVRP